MSMYLLLYFNCKVTSGNQLVITMLTGVGLLWPSQENWNTKAKTFGEGALVLAELRLSCAWSLLEGRCCLSLGCEAM